MHGTGNDFVLLDRRQPSAPAGVPDDELARNMCDRRFGVGADGLIFVETGTAAPIRMRMLNPDGSVSEMCGNGLRCVAALIGEGTISIETGGRVVQAESLDQSRIRVDMGVAEVLDPRLESSGFLGVSITVGNPHYVVFCDNVGGIDLETVGPLIEQAPEFPHRTNVHFAEVIDRGHIRQRTWERGAGITLACGSGACAGALAAVATGRTDRAVAVDLPGGRLDLEVEPDGRVWMTGPAETVFSGSYRLR